MTFPDANGSIPWDLDTDITVSFLGEAAQLLSRAQNASSVVDSLVGDCAVAASALARARAEVDRLREQLAEREREEKAWVIEAVDHPVWVCKGGVVRGVYTSAWKWGDIDSAIRFSRREDAEAVAGMILTDPRCVYRITEHLWILPKQEKAQ